MMSHADARDVIRAALRQPRVRAVLEGRPDDPVLEQAFQAQAWLESGYGSGRAKNNWGSVQAGHGPPCKPGSVELTDKHKDGTPYQWCYRVYDTPTAGAVDMMWQVLRRPWMEKLMRSGDATAIEKGLRSRGEDRKGKRVGAYLEGPHNYALGLEKRSKVLSEVLSEPQYVVRGGGRTRPKVRKRARGGGAAAGIAAMIVLGILAARR